MIPAPTLLFLAIVMHVSLLFVWNQYKERDSSYDSTGFGCITLASAVEIHIYLQPESINLLALGTPRLLGENLILILLLLCKAITCARAVKTGLNP